MREPGTSHDSHLGEASLRQGSPHAGTRRQILTVLQTLAPEGLLPIPRGSSGDGTVSPGVSVSLACASVPVDWRFLTNGYDQEEY